jgi:hypothetical protein
MICSGGTTGAGVAFKQADSKLYPGFGNLTFGADGVAVTTGVWYVVNLKVNSSTNPWTIDLKVDSTATTQLTNATAGASNTQYWFGSPRGDINVTMDAFFDDIVITNTAVDYPIGDGHVDPFVLIADGTHNIAGSADFQRGNTGVDILNATTTAYQLVDDVPLPTAVDAADCWLGLAPANPATDYVEGIFGPAPGISTPTVAPRAVEVVLAHHQIATTVGQMQVKLNDNGTLDTTFDTGAAAGVTTLRYARKHYATGPAGAWVIGGGGNGDFTDLRVRFFAPDANPDQCLDAIMIEAEFAPAVSGYKPKPAFNYQPFLAQ